MAGSPNHIIDVATRGSRDHQERPEWVSYVKARLDDKSAATRLRSEVVSIYTVPGFLVHLKGDAYVPQLVSLGPLHHENQALSAMLPYKIEAARRIRSRLQNGVEFDDVVAAVRGMDFRVRDCYQQEIHFGPETLAWMLTLDACFILTILRGLDKGADSGSQSNSDYPLFHRSIIEYSAYSIITDILLLENQIPFSVLHKVLEMQLLLGEDATCELCRLLFDARITWLFYPLKSGSWLQEKIPYGYEFKHLLDLFRLSVIYSSFPDTEAEFQFAMNRKRKILIPSAKEMQLAGIRFKCSPGKLEGIKFEDTFYLPKIRVSTTIEVVLRNLMALEICEAKDVCIISRYVALMSELVSSERDVSVLKRAGIIKSYMASDKEVAQLFNGLCKGITRSYIDPFAEVRKHAHDRYHSKAKVMLAEFLHDHFSKPWKSASVVGAVLILLFTAVQTFFSLPIFCHR